MRISSPTLLIMFAISVIIYKYDKPYERGFYCNDYSIFKPFYATMIPMYYLLFFASSIPTLSIILIEFKFSTANKRLLLEKLNHFYFGLILTFILVLLCKNFFGRLRPNSIIGLCNAGDYCEANSSLYIDRFTCDNSNPKFVKESRMSFYSGHSSVGTYSAFYLILFIYYRIKANQGLKLTLQLIVLIIGLIPGFTQGINYWHHWSDIMTGYSVGAITAFLVIKYVSEL